MGDGARNTTRIQRSMMQNIQQSILNEDASDEYSSRATTPGFGFSTNFMATPQRKVYKNKTFPYFKLLPYKVEEETERNAALAEILKQLYISVKSEDLSSGVVYWTRELRAWMSLKFQITNELRAKLVKLYYMLTLAPGMDRAAADRFESMFRYLLKKKSYLKPGKDLILDWRPLWAEVKRLAMPLEATQNPKTQGRSYKSIAAICAFAPTYFDPRERKTMLEEILPFFSTSDISGAFIAIGSLNLLLPTEAAPDEPDLTDPQEYLPTIFHLWSLVNRSKSLDVMFIDFLSRLARDHVSYKHVAFSEHGIFTKDQSDYIFTAVLRLTEIPVGQALSPYSGIIDLDGGLGMLIDKDKKRNPVGYSIARWIVMCLSPSCIGKSSSILSSLEGLMQSVDTFFHPSNLGEWTEVLPQITFHLVDFFVTRWNREQSEEIETPPDRCINSELKRRFVLSLREVVFLGLFSKKAKSLNYFFGAFRGLAILEPHLVLPGALQRFYPSLQGLVEVHRTQSSLCGLQMVANILSQQKGLRCHITALLALALPGIDANDPQKTIHTLNFITAVAYCVPFHNLTSSDSEISDSSLAIQWVQGEMERMEREGPNIEIDYTTELGDDEEAKILRSSTASFGEFVLSLLERIFTLLENLPELSRARSGSPEENIINTLPATATPLFASLSPEIFDQALDRIVTFVGSRVIHQSRDAMAFLCNSLCKANPEKTLKVFVPMLVVGIRYEIDHNDAASDRSSGTEVLPRDRAIVWYISILSMIIVHVGDSVMKYKKELFDIAIYMQEKCKGIPTIHISNYVHHLLLNLTLTYPLDGAMYEPEVFKKGLDVTDWAKTTKPKELTIKWHVPSQNGIEFALELFESQVNTAFDCITDLISDNPSISMKGKNIEWSDEVSRSLKQLRLILSGISTLFDPKYVSENTNDDLDKIKVETQKFPTEEINKLFEDTDSLSELPDEEETKPQVFYPAGYPLEKDSNVYIRIHELREKVGHLLCRTHDFLSNAQEDAVACFTALSQTYRTWITDVGNERSAQMLERMVKLYSSDIRPFKINGSHKVYPRCLLIKRAGIYHLQRVKYNASARHQSHLDSVLIQRLATSCVSSYADVRINAQSALEAVLKSVIGGRILVIPFLLYTYKMALKEPQFDIIKGCLFTLFYLSLGKTLIRDWRFAPVLIELYIKTTSVGKPSIQKISTHALYGSLSQIGKSVDTYVLVDDKVVKYVEPEVDTTEEIKLRNGLILERRKNIENAKSELSFKLIEVSKNSHWKVALRCAVFILNSGLRFQTLVSPELIELVVNGCIDDHPSLRNTYFESLTRIFTQIHIRQKFSHSFEKFVRDEENTSDLVEVIVQKDDPNWTKNFLASFQKSEVPNYFVDRDYPGWLVWQKKFQATRACPLVVTDWDELERSVRVQIGSLLTREWYSKLFGYMKQEPRSSTVDRFRISITVLLSHAFNLTVEGLSTATFEDLKELLKETFGDGTDMHQHRTAAEIIGAMLLSGQRNTLEIRNKLWSFAVPFLLDIISDGLTPDTIAYWMTCLHIVLGGKDPRRSREIYDKLISFRLDMSSNAAFKESAKIQMLEFAIQDAGWHFRSEAPILEDFLSHINHPYKTVREAVGRTIASIFRTRYYEAFMDLDQLLAANKAASSLGIRGYAPPESFTLSIKDTFDKIEKWRSEREAGQQAPSSYTSGCKTVLVWLDTTLQSFECTQLLPFFHDVLMEPLLQMMDIKEDPELQCLAYHVYRHLPNIPFRVGEDEKFISALIRIGKVSKSWHQRLRTLINMQVLYFRRIFLILPEQQQALFNAISDMLEDPQHEVRQGASSTLSGMIRCSPVAFRSKILPELKAKFMHALMNNPMPKRTPGTSTPVSFSNNQQVIRRHAAVLGLGAMLTAFPYVTPPPDWMPETLAILASRAANDPGAIGKTVKQILADFKKTRQDTWIIDQKYFTTEQLEDLEGVLWKSYFA
ncbi:hypothetical protein K3495_g10150 [Podosphaera aphanis]|nr:hypothetical protein K3495_g10150 [Podosphaera aphanis]